MNLRDIALERLCSQNIEYHRYKSPSELVDMDGCYSGPGLCWS